MAITLRDEKNLPLTHQEVDANFRSFFYTASFSENNLSLQRKDGVTVNVPIGGEAFASFQANGGSIGNVFIADSQITGSRMIVDLFQGQFYDKTKAMNSDGGTLSSDEWYIDFDPAASAPYYVHFGSNFAISSSGYLYASGAVIEGDITASSGLIGGFNITPDAIHGPAVLGIPSFYISGSATSTDHFISARNFSLKGNGDITGSSVLFDGGKIAGWEISNSQIKKSTNIILDATNESISIKSSTFGNSGIQLEYNSGTPRFYVGDGSTSFAKFDGTDISISTKLLEISASNLEISSTEASMSLGEGVKLLGATSAIEIGTANKFRISGSATDAMIVAGTKTGFATNDAGIILGMDSAVPTLDLTKDASNYVRFDTTSGVDIKTDTFKLDTTNFDIDTSTARLTIFDTGSKEIIRLGEISDSASDLYGLKIYDGSGTGSANTIAMFGQQGNKVGGWEVTDSQIRTIPAAGFGGNYTENETGLIIHSSGKLESSNFATNLKGWRIDTLGNGSAEFENMRIRGTLKTTVFEKETVNVVGGQLMVTNASTIQALRDADGSIIAGSASYAANAVTLSLENVSGFEEGEVLKVKTVDATGFGVEYMYVSGSKRYSEDASLSYNTGSIDPDGLAGELYVERSFGGVVNVSSSLTTLSSAVADTSIVTINVASNSGFLLQSIIKIDDERLKVVGVNNNIITVVRGYHDTTPTSHTTGDTVFIVDTDKEFLSGLVSAARPLTEGQVILSTGVYNPSSDISSGYILMNANPRDVSTPYMDIVERTGSGVYDLQLRSRLGDLSGLSSGYLYGNNEPGFGLYTENGFFKGAITAETGSIAGILHVATVAGGLETGQKISIGRDVSGTNDGIYVNNNNYWYTDGGWKVGGSANFISLDNFTDGNLVVKTETFTLDTSTFMISSSLNSGTLTAGVTASAITSTTGAGIYLDGTGKFRVGTPTSGDNYIYWDGSTLNIKGAIDITGGTGATSADLDAITGSLSSSLATEISSSDASLSGSLASTSDTLDGKIFTDSSGRAVRPPTASSEGLYMASTNLGFYKGGEWKTYMDNQGDFFLTGSAGNKLAWNSTTGTLEIAGSINITGGNGATQDYVTGSVDTISGSIATDLTSVSSSISSSLSASSATLQDGLDSANSVISGKAAIFRQDTQPSTSGRTVGDMWIDSNDGNKVYVWNGTAWTVTPDGTYDQTVLINSTSASLSSSVALDIFTDSTGKLVSTPSTSSAGLYLGDDALGFYSASEWRTYMANNGNFYLTGSDGNFLAWDGGQLTIQGSINITGGNAATSASVADAQTAAETFASASSAIAINSGSDAATAAQTAAEATAAAALGSATSSLSSSIGTLDTNTSASLATQAETNAALTLVQDGLNSIFRQNEAPATESRHQGDVWIDQNDGEKLYIFSGSGWVEASDTTYDQSALITNTSSSLALDTFTDSTGKIVSTPNPSAAGLYLGDSNLGFYSASEWRTYMADNGNFFLTGSDSNYLKWDGGALTVSGDINIVGGNAATTSSVASAASAAVASGSAAAAAVSSSLTSSIAQAQSTAVTASTQAAAATQTALTASVRTVDADGQITFNPTPTGEGLFLNADNLGYYSGSDWTAYLSASGEFFLTGSGSSGMSWDGQSLSIDGTVTAVDGEIGGISIASDKLHTGTGTHGNGNTGFYIDSGSNFSLGDKLVWDGTDLTINGSITVSNSNDFASQAELDASITASETSISNTAATASAEASAAQTAAQNFATGSAASAQTAAENFATTASNAAQTAAESTAAGALTTAEGTLSALATGSAANAVLSGSAAATAASNALTSSISSAQATANDATSSAASAQSTANDATSSAATAQSTADAATGSAATALDRSVDASGKITFNPTPSGQGLFMNSTNLGFYSGSAWGAYLSASGEFYLTGSGNSGMSWDGSELSVDGTVTAVAGAIGGITLESDKLYNGAGTHSAADTGFYVDSSSNFSLGNKLTWDGSNLTINGSITVSNTSDFVTPSQLDTATGSLETFTSASTAGAIDSGSAAASSAAAGVQSNLNTATGSLQNYADGAVTDITGSINSAQSTANTATGSAASAQSSANSAQSTANTATGSAASAQSTANAATGSAATALATANAASASALAAQERTVDADGKITFNPTPSGEGLFMNSTNLGFYSGSAWGAYLSASGEFYLTGSNSSGMSWDGSDLSIDGTVTAVAGGIGGWTIDSTSIFSGTKDTSAYTAGGITISSTSGGSIHAKQFYIDTSGNANFKGNISGATGTIGGWTIDSDSIFTGTKDTEGYVDDAGITLSGDGSLHAKQFYIDTDGNANFSGALSAASGTFSGALSAATGTFSGALSAATGTFGGSVSIGTGNNIFKATTSGISLGHATQASAPFRVTQGGNLTATAGQIGNWVIGGQNLLRDTNNRIFLDPDNKRIQMNNSGGDTRIEIASSDLASISPTKPIDAGYAAGTDKLFTLWSDSSATSRNNTDFGGQPADAISTSEQFTNYNITNHATKVTAAFNHPGGSLPVTIPIGGLAELGTFRVTMHDFVNGSGNLGTKHYQNFDYAVVEFKHTLFTTIETFTQTGCENSPSWKVVSGATDTTELSNNIGAGAQNKIYKSDLAGAANGSFLATKAIKPTRTNSSRTWESQTISIDAGSQPEASYRASIVHRTEARVKYRYSSYGSRTTGTSTGGGGGNFNLSFSDFVATNTPVTFGTFTSQVKMGLNGVQISGPAGTVVMGEVAESGVASLYGNVLVTGTLTANISGFSDVRLKDNIKNIVDPLTVIGNLNPKSFTWKNNVNPDETRTDSYGFIAQEVSGSFPSLVSVQPKVGHIENILSVEQTPFIALNTAGIKQLIEKIASLETRIAELE